jgi:two-component system nitrogen regulation response regulator GlnG
MRWVHEGKGDVVITDVIMPDGNGLEMLPKIGELRPDLPVIVISAQNTIMTAIRAEEADAYDYLPKPFDLPDLMKRTAKALNRPRRVSTADTTQEKQADELPMVGRTPAMQELYRLVARVMNTDLPVLISGESGTGKSLIAREIHDFSDRRSLPFIAVSAADLSAEGGADRILAKVRGGTLLFEDVSDVDDELQAQIVRIIDNPGEHGPRFLATTQRNFAQDLEHGKLRADLYYRMNGAAINVPALRARVDDILLLAEHFLAKTEREGAPLRWLSGDAQAALRLYSGPGNVRQLENTIKRLVLTARAEEITASEVALVISNQPDPEAPSGRDAEKLSDAVSRHLQRYFDLHGDMLPPAGVYTRILREIELPMIEIALDATGGNQAKCADLLGINRNTLRKKITELDIRVTRRRKLM